MATNFDKALYTDVPPLDVSPQPDIEIEVQDPEEMHIGIGGIEIDLEPNKSINHNDDFYANLADDLDEGELNSIAAELIELVDQDIYSRKDWAETYVKGLEVLGMKYEERTEPWNGACGVFSTVLTEAAIRFQSETIGECFPAAGPVKTQIIGAIDQLKQEMAERVQEDMNYELTDVMLEYRPEHELSLIHI